MRVLVTGGAGYIGSHAVRELMFDGHVVTVVDDLSTGHRESLPSGINFVESTIEDSELVSKVLRDDRIDAVMHFATGIDVSKSVSDPYQFYQKNFSASLALLEAMNRCLVKKIVFSSSADVYGATASFPVKESAPLDPVTPYAVLNQMIERMVIDGSKAHGLKFAILRYFNVAGALPDGSIGEFHRPETHLIPKLLIGAASGSGATIFGSDYPTYDGTCIRDFVHVVDLAQAHVLALDLVGVDEESIFNVGSEKGYSVLQIIEACKTVTGVDFKVTRAAKRPGDLPFVLTDSGRLRSKGWQPRYGDIETMVTHAWKWHRSHPDGYKS